MNHQAYPLDRGESPPPDDAHNRFACRADCNESVGSVGDADRLRMTNLARYSTEEYWERVGQRLKSRDDNGSVIAGNDTLFYRHKRTLFLERFLGPVVDESASVLEVGSGPGGNLTWLAPRVALAAGADISPHMLEVARRNGARCLVRMDGRQLPFRDQSCSVVFTATVLQHNDNARCSALLREMARVCGDRIHLFEDTAPLGVRDRPSHWLRRPSWYTSHVEPLGFELTSVERLALTWQELTAVGLRAGLRGRHEEGAPLSNARLRLERQLLRFARVPDRLLPPIAGLTRMSFRRRG